MDDLDDTDREILRLLLEDGRRSWSAIGDAVGLSGPAVADRVTRLQERGVVDGFTVDIDRSLLQDGVEVLVELETRPGHADPVRDDLVAADAFEHVFVTAEERVYATATVPTGETAGVLQRAVDLDAVREYEVRLLAETAWTPGIGEADLAPECAECGNTVDSEGETVTLDGDTYYFCCGSCRSNFVDQYERLSEGA
ncbi:MAG: AsnC family transcriptional regulator [Haloarculaceae archaeon]